MSHRLVQRPSAVVFRIPDPPVRMLVCLITRGMADVLAVTDAVRMAELHNAGLAIIAGFPAVEAKNKAAALAVELGASLLLMEDDILADPLVWAAALRPYTSSERSPIRLATTRCRNGTRNTRLHADGTVLSSGTCFVVVPHAVLLDLPEPRFAAYDVALVGGELVLRGPNPNGQHSDTYFWYQVRRIAPRPPVVLIGEVTHLVTDGNRERHDLVTPSVVGVA